MPKDPMEYLLIVTYRNGNIDRFQFESAEHLDILKKDVVRILEAGTRPMTFLALETMAGESEWNTLVVLDDIRKVEFVIREDVRLAEIEKCFAPPPARPSPPVVTR